MERGLEEKREINLKALNLLLKWKTRQRRASDPRTEEVSSRTQVREESAGG
jgi:hypothetical protein